MKEDEFSEVSNTDMLKELFRELLSDSSCARKNCAI